MNDRLTPSVLVLVTNQTSCERLIRVGNTLAGDKTGLRVLSIRPKKDVPESGDALEHLSSVAAGVGAKMAIYYSDSPIETIGMYARRYLISRLVVGNNPTGSSLFIAKLKAAFPDTPISIVLADMRVLELGTDN